jgi:hypothetical protein
MAVLMLAPAVGSLLVVNPPPEILMLVSKVVLLGLLLTPEVVLGLCALLPWFLQEGPI